MPDPTDGPSCGRSDPHPRHKYMRGNGVYTCPGPQTAGGDDLRDRIAEALAEKFTPDGKPSQAMRVAFQASDGWPATRMVTAEEAADAVLGVLPVPADRAAIRAAALREAVAELKRDALGVIPRLLRMADEAQQQPDTETPSVAALEQEVKRLGLMVDEYGTGASALTDKLKRVRDRHRETCILVQGQVPPSAFRCGLCEVLDAPASGPGVVVEAPATDTDEAGTPYPHTMLGAAELEERPDLNFTRLPADARTSDAECICTEDACPPHCPCHADEVRP